MISGAVSLAKSVFHRLLNNLDAKLVLVGLITVYLLVSLQIQFPFQESVILCNVNQINK
jgi:hypothetical protein